MPAAAGRAANVGGVGLESAGVRYDEVRGVLVNDLAQSVSNPNVYAVGDCVAHVPRLTHSECRVCHNIVHCAIILFRRRSFSFLLTTIAVPKCPERWPRWWCKTPCSGGNGS